MTTYLAAATIEDGADHIAKHPELESAFVVTPRAVRRIGARGPGDFATTPAFDALIAHPGLGWVSHDACKLLLVLKRFAGWAEHGSVTVKPPPRREVSDG